MAKKRKRSRKSNLADSYSATGAQWAFAALVTGTVIGLAALTKHVENKARTRALPPAPFVPPNVQHAGHPAYSSE